MLLFQASNMSRCVHPAVPVCTLSTGLWRFTLGSHEQNLEFLSENITTKCPPLKSVGMVLLQGQAFFGLASKRYQKEQTLRGFDPVVKKRTVSLSRVEAFHLRIPPSCYLC